MAANRRAAAGPIVYVLIMKPQASLVGIMVVLMFNWDFWSGTGLQAAK